MRIRGKIILKKTTYIDDKADIVVYIILLNEIYGDIL
jgi:hypothetical protein